ncbi:MAG: cysteine--tRNA ligase [Sphingomonas sp. SCN 67-18]|uniref:cysteine--tRNA ligase n=1 Tax=uncultured Sphingomonas sp. TaxID=158754 RepID=UPI00086A9082|nr:cysteine--tRNA ligase [Sphingomonas sp. SCN 67-18]ODU21033.1 MAG: cysteine--tRNA ligase [Sphingomonas sp. SCN 67-18]
MTHHAPAGAPLTLFNSLSRATDPFVPIDPAMVRIYSCGPTVYNFAHLGNLRAYVFTDTLRRTLNWKGYAVNHVINITDVGHLTSDADAGDDKMEAAAERAGKSIWEIAAFYTAAFKADLARLNIRTPTLWSTATDHVQDMIAFAREIADKHCYRLDSGLYFDSGSVPDYGRLAGARGEETVGRIAEVDGKRNPSDFAIWRASAPGERRQMEWQSPWGPGAPGWHLECSVMSMKYLGAQFDIHTGGIDHREIHHVNEIAQNQAYTGCAETGANWWMHNNFLIDRGGKMSKSAGGFATLQSLVDRGVHPLAYRLLCLSAHYRSELEFSTDSLSAALTRLRRLVIAVSALRDKAGEAGWMRVLDEAEAGRGASSAWQRAAIESGLSDAGRKLLTQFDEAISADLMMPRALPLIEDVAAMKALPADERLRLVATMDLALGLDLIRLSRADLRLRPARAAISEEAVEARIAARRAARAEKDFATSDAIRDELMAAGIEIMDGDPLGWDWAIALD